MRAPSLRLVGRTDANLLEPLVACGLDSGHEIVGVDPGVLRSLCNALSEVEAARPERELSHVEVGLVLQLSELQEDDLLLQRFPGTTFPLELLGAQQAQRRSA